MALDLTLAIGDYDRVRALQTGEVSPEGIDLNVVNRYPGELFWRVSQHQEFKLSEMSLSTFTLWTSQGDCPYVGIPVFPSRIFRHGSIYVNPDAGIDSPEDLRGKKIGVEPEYQITAATWARGMLQHEYGVEPTEMEWYAENEEKYDVSLPDDLDIQVIDDDQDLERMLARGEIDAHISVLIPKQLGDGIERLFDDFVATERDYYERTGLFPIMHTLVLHRDIYDDHPWVAREMYEAMCEAKEVAMNRLFDTNALSVSLPWLVAHVEETREAMGDDYWPYGFEPNRHTVETLTQYSYEQGLSDRKVDPEELFADELLRTGGSGDEYYREQRLDLDAGRE